MGIHKWKNYGDRVPITWTESGLIPGTKKEMRKHVFSERECLRCGIREKRKLDENIDGTKAAVGWERITESKTGS
jgi:hypothetical protein